LPNVLPEHLIPPSKRHLVVNGSPTGGNTGLYPAIGSGGGGAEQNTNDDN
jgi:hypothetical protein